MVAIVVALIPATWFTAQRAFDSSSAVPGDTSTDLPIPPVSPSATETAAKGPAAKGPSASPSRSAAPARLARIAPDAPRRIVSGNLIDAGFDSAVTAIEPSSTTEVARLESRGSPGSPGTDTVYVIGRVVAGDSDSAFAELPGLRRGAKVSIRTDRGTLTYTVRASTLEPEAALPRDPLFTARTAGRLVLVGIRYAASGDRLNQALVVTAELTGAARA